MYVNKKKNKNICIHLLHSMYLLYYDSSIEIAFSCLWITLLALSFIRPHMRTTFKFSLTLAQQRVHPDTVDAFKIDIISFAYERFDSAQNSKYEYYNICMRDVAHYYIYRKWLEYIHIGRQSGSDSIYTKSIRYAFQLKPMTSEILKSNSYLIAF